MKISATNQPLSRRAAKKIATRERILETATRMFTERGYEGTTVDELAKAAGISKPTFFSYFPAKSMVLSALVEDTFDQFLIDAEALLAQDASTAERFSKLFDASATNIIENAELSKLLVSNVFRLMLDNTAEGASIALSGVRNALAAVINQGREQGDVNTFMALEAQTKMVSGIYLTTLLEWLGSPEYTSLRGQLKVAAEMISQALRPMGPTATR